MDSDLFWYFAGALVLAAVVLAFVGLRSKGSWPTSGGPVALGIGIFAALVVATGAFAIAYAQDEQDHRAEELAAEEAEAAAEEPPGGPTETQPAPAGGGQATQPAPSAGETLDVTSPDDGSLVFEPDAFEASAGEVTLAYDNPSPVAHNINIEDDQGQTLAESDDVTGAATEATETLVPGEYTFYCSIPGHREGGMEGTLTVQ